MTTNQFLLLTLGICFVLQILGLWVAVRLVRAGGRTARDSELPTLRSPAIPSEFTRGEWSAL